MLNKEQKDKLKLIVESIDDKLTKEGYIFTARHFDVVMDGMEQLLKQCRVSGSLPPDLQYLKTLIPVAKKELEATSKTIGHEPVVLNRLVQKLEQFIGGNDH